MALSSESAAPAGELLPATRRALIHRIAAREDPGRLLADRGLEFSPVAGRGRASRFRAEPDGTWTGLDGYYAGETLRLVRGADGTVDHIDLGSFVFTREPYERQAPQAAQPDPEGWRAF